MSPRIAETMFEHDAIVAHLPFPKAALQSLMGTGHYSMRTSGKLGFDIIWAYSANGCTRSTDVAVESYNNEGQFVSIEYLKEL